MMNKKEDIDSKILKTFEIIEKIGQGATGVKI